MQRVISFAVRDVIRNTFNKNFCRDYIYTVSHLKEYHQYIIPLFTSIYISPEIIEVIAKEFIFCLLHTPTSLIRTEIVLARMAICLIRTVLAVSGIAPLNLTTAFPISTVAFTILYVVFPNHAAVRSAVFLIRTAVFYNPHNWMPYSHNKISNSISISLLLFLFFPPNR